MIRSLDARLVLTLNNAHVEETSELSPTTLTALLAMAFYARGIDDGATAFLIALDHTAAYNNPNFDWFKAHYESFVYIDRVIVSGSARGRGVARMLYEDLFSAAQKAGQIRVVCEVNIDPPNPISNRFHFAMGFVEVGQATLYNGKKTVRYFARLLS